MIALLLALAAVPLDPVATMSEVTVTGWSADETKFSVRAFERVNPGDMGEEAVECAGYLDQNGKKFNGRLVLAAYDKGVLVESWVVQEYPKCTPPAKAKETLALAKAKFAELGIDLTLKGTQLKCEKSCDLKHGGAQLVFENATRSSSNEESMQGTLSGTVRVWVKTAKEKTKLFEQAVKTEFPLMMGGRAFAQLRPVELSPKGSAMLVRASIEEKNGRGESSSQLPVGFFVWSGDVLEKR